MASHQPPTFACVWETTGLTVINVVSAAVSRASTTAETVKALIPALSIVRPAFNRKWRDGEKEAEEGKITTIYSSHLMMGRPPFDGRVTSSPLPLFVSSLRSDSPPTQMRETSHACGRRVRFSPRAQTFCLRHESCAPPSDRAFTTGRRHLASLGWTSPSGR